MRKKYITEYALPCGKTFQTKIDVGYAHGICVGAKKGDSYEYSNEDCEKCTLGCAHNHTISVLDEETRQLRNQQVVTCVGYTQKYLERKDRETVKELDTTDVGKYIIELIIQRDEYRAVLYLEGKSKNVCLLNLVDETAFEGIFKKYYDKEMEACVIWMTSLETGESAEIDFERPYEIMTAVVSARFIEADKKKV